MEAKLVEVKLVGWKLSKGSLCVSNFVENYSSGSVNHV